MEGENLRLVWNKVPDTLFYLAPIINGTGTFSIEEQTRDQLRMDVVILMLYRIQAEKPLKSGRNQALFRNGLIFLCFMPSHGLVLLFSGR